MNVLDSQLARILTLSVEQTPTCTSMQIEESILCVCKLELNRAQFLG